MTPDAESIDFSPVQAELETPLGVHWIHGSESAKHNTDPRSKSIGTTSTP